jgi:hypothetical protein
MAQLTELDIDCLEYQEGMLSGVIRTAWGQPEQMARYAGRYASVLALLGRAKEHDYYALIASTAVHQVGQAARKAWDERPLLHRLFTGRRRRRQWQSAYTDSLFIEADDALRRVRDDVAVYRAMTSRYFKKDGARRAVR